MNGRMGNGSWDFETYWRVNHGASGRPPPLVGSEPASNSNLPSRYSIYRYEIEQGIVGDISYAGETGAPACYGGDLLQSTPDRRIVQAAVINCLPPGERAPARHRHRTRMVVVRSARTASRSHKWCQGPCAAALGQAS